MTGRAWRGAVYVFGWLAIVAAACAEPAATNVPPPSDATTEEKQSSSIVPSATPSSPGAPSSVLSQVSPSFASPAVSPSSFDLRFKEAFGGRTFNKPVGLYHAGDGGGRLFVVEQPGRIVMLEDASDRARGTVFLDIRDRVNDRGWEQGLLGLAFHPDFRKNGFFYVNYTTEKTTVVSRFRTDPRNPDQADPASERILLEFAQPYANHNGGQIAFGPDGYLYIATGDGGSAGDPHGNGQNLKTLLGKILRIDVDRADAGKPYAIPPDNPFAGRSEGYREEIYAYGFRNPWRFSFDPETGCLWAADVGQNSVEEIDIVVRGGNYGWNVMEGSRCYRPTTGCRRDGLILPVWEYSPLVGGASVTGGFVYRGRDVPALVGKYVFADFMDGRVWTLEYDGRDAKAALQRVRLKNISSFGVDGRGELYAVTLEGKIYRIVGD